MNALKTRHGFHGIDKVKHDSMQDMFDEVMQQVGGINQLGLDPSKM